MKRPLAIALLPMLLIAAPGTDAADRMELVEVRKIWDRAPHNAFTDLERFKGRWYCAFREGQGHAGAGDHGKLRVIRSRDGITWESAALFETPNVDLRDAKLSVTPNGELLVNSVEYRVNESTAEDRNNRSVSYLSRDGTTWEGPLQIADHGYWLWQTTWQKGTGYAIGYKWGNKDATRLYTTRDGREYTMLVDHIRPPRDRSNEHAALFDADGAAWVFLRRDNAADARAGVALLGTAAPPYRDWEWRRLPMKAGGPAMIQLPDKRVIAAMRRYDGTVRTELGFLDLKRAGYRPALTLPSGGDTSYAGLVWHEGQLWVSYYSSHEGKTSIYLAKVRVPGAERSATSPIALGSRRELFVDHHLVDSLKDASLRLQPPRRAGTAFAFDQPWEGVFSGYPTVLYDQGTYRMYYRGMPGSQHDFDTEVTCYAFSKDGIDWIKPDLRQYEVGGTRDNNVILARHHACHNFSPFIDTNPDATPSERYKALGGNNEHGLFLLVSADGVRWRQKGDKPAFIDRFKGGWSFDSQNVCFWSESEQRYVLYYRRFINGLRTIYRVTSPDLVTWSKPQNTEANRPGEHLYTNQTHPYYRAPHLYVAFPKRFFPGKVAIDPELAARLVDNPGYRRDTADVVLMTSRSGLHYDRTFLEGFIRPGPSPRDWISRSNAAGLGVVPSRDDRVMYLYRLSHYGQKTTHMTRYELRTDGFASVSAGAAGGELTTHAVTFSGKALHLNFQTSAGGSVRVELQDARGNALPGYSLKDSIELVGDHIDRVAAWNSTSDVRSLAGKPVRLRFKLVDADLFSFQFNQP